MLPCSSGSADAGADKDSGQETVPGGAVHRLLQADALPTSRREENNARPSTFESPSVPGNPCHNIIPSVLWNSRHQPHCHAVTASIKKGQKPAPRSIVIPGYAERWGYELDKYQEYARFILIDIVTGYRSQSQDYSTIISAIS